MIPNGIRIRSAIFPQCTGQTDAQTHRPTHRPTDLPRESLITIGRCATRAARPNHNFYFTYLLTYLLTCLCYKDVVSRGTSADLARAFSNVKQRSQDLLKLNVDELEAMALRTAKISFQPHRHPRQRQQQKDEQMDNVVGLLEIDEETSHQTGCAIAAEACCHEHSDEENDDNDETDAAGEGEYRAQRVQYTSNFGVLFHIVTTSETEIN